MEASMVSRKDDNNLMLATETEENLEPPTNIQAEVSHLLQPSTAPTSQQETSKVRNIQSDIIPQFNLPQNGDQLTFTLHVSRASFNPVLVPYRSVYVSCCMFSGSPVAQSQMVSGKCPVFDLWASDKQSFSDRLTEVLENKSLVMEVWGICDPSDERSSEESLVGIVDIPWSKSSDVLKKGLYAKYISSRQPPRTVTDLIAVNDDSIRVMNPFDGSSPGTISVMIAVGSALQMQKLRQMCDAAVVIQCMARVRMAKNMFHRLKMDKHERTQYISTTVHPLVVSLPQKYKSDIQQNVQPSCEIPPLHTTIPEILQTYSLPPRIPPIPSHHIVVSANQTDQHTTRVQPVVTLRSTSTIGRLETSRAASPPTTPLRSALKFLRGQEKSTRLKLDIQKYSERTDDQAHTGVKESGSVQNTLYAFRQQTSVASEKFQLRVCIQKAAHLNPVLSPSHDDVSLSIRKSSSNSVPLSIHDTINNSVLKIEVHHRPNSKLRQLYHEKLGIDSSKTIRSKTDILLGTVSVDMFSLCAGFSTISGWYNISDAAGKTAGQIYISVSPIGRLESILDELNFQRSQRFSEETPGEPIIDEPSQIATDQTTTDTGAIRISGPSDITKSPSEITKSAHISVSSTQNPNLSPMIDQTLLTRDESTMAPDHQVSTLDHCQQAPSPEPASPTAKSCTSVTTDEQTQTEADVKEQADEETMTEDEATPETKWSVLSPSETFEGVDAIMRKYSDDPSFADLKHAMCELDSIRERLQRLGRKVDDQNGEEIETSSKQVELEPVYDVP
eukprot:731224_1